MNDGVSRWREIAPPEPVNGDLLPLLRTVDTLRSAWKGSIERATPEQFAEARQRSLRRHAIETGIIEWLYDVDWGVTAALVAEGLSGEVAAREGGISEDVLATINSQFEALAGIAEAAREGQELTVFFVRQLHGVITGHQRTYSATTELGHVVEVPLRHGQWKLRPNRVRRSDGSVLEYAPPEQVQSQMDRLIQLYTTEANKLHPVVAATWLHYGFSSIHPFEDGNGRVARALSLLALLRHDYAPLVVDRTRRESYLGALDKANDGDLAPLVRLFAELEIIALRSELELPARPTVAGAVDVAHAYAERLLALRRGEAADLARATTQLAGTVNERISAHLESLGKQLRSEFAGADPNARSNVSAVAPPDSRSKWWRAQLVRTANALDFYTNLTDGAWWSQLRLTVLDSTLRYVVATQKVGHGETGVLAVTVFAEIPPPPSPVEGSAGEGDEEARPLPTPALAPMTSDSVTLIHTDDPEDRWNDIADLIDRTLAAAVDSFGRQLG